MNDMSVEPRVARVRFTGKRPEMAGILSLGFVMQILTLGIYRFWMLTFKRRFYWSHTEIDGDALEYTGRAVQLLVGFLIALVFFLPFYGVFFFLSTQRPEVVLTGYAVIGSVLWFFMGYALYRGRDFRLSRTLWRGIRFDQTGNAWAYATRRFLWSIAMVITLGLIYPAMTADLWRYRQVHTFYGDRQFSFSGSWKLIAGPFYTLYFSVLAMVAITLVAVLMVRPSAIEILSHKFILPFSTVTVLVSGSLYYWYRAREISRLGSATSCGEARLTIKVSGLTLLGQHVIYALALIVLAVIASGALAIAMELLKAQGGLVRPSDIAHLLNAGLLNVVILIIGYLAMLATFAGIGELFLSLGFWKAVANGATIANVESLRTVRSGGEDKSLVGEGLADALNVGAY